MRTENCEMKNKLIVILGPTCTGKTALALKLREELNGAIISADSRQVYKGMSIGTGKSGDGVGCYDLINPNELFTVVDWAKVAKAAIEKIVSQGKMPIVVGGTGFYLDILTGRATVAGVMPDEKLRLKLNGLTAKKLFDKLEKLDPVRANAIDKNNPVRIIRAIEVASTGKSKESNNLSYDCAPIYIGLTAPRAILYKRADNFVNSLVPCGILDEIKNLIEAGYENSKPMSGLIYNEFFKFIKGENTLEDAITRCQYDMHAYIRRQLTWFNRNSEVTWFNICDKDLYEKVRTCIQSNYGT